MLALVKRKCLHDSRAKLLWQRLKFAEMNLHGSWKAAPVKTLQPQRHISDEVQKKFSRQKLHQLMHVPDGVQGELRTGAVA